METPSPTPEDVMSKIGTIHDTGIARLIWEGHVFKTRDEKSAVSVSEVAEAFRENGTELDHHRAYHRARRTIADLTTAQEAVWVTDPDGLNTYYRMLTFKERVAIQDLKLKSAKPKVHEDNFK
jgi:predicted phosphoribosyltransferase